MFIRVQDLELQKLEFDKEFPAGTLDLGPDLKQAGALKTSGRAELVEENRGPEGRVKDIRVVGKLAAQIESRCDRCLEPLTREVKSEFDLIYRPLGVDARADEVEISEAETEIGYYSGDGLQLEDVMREQILLSLPMKRLCREDCKGLCAHCGQNLNSATCDCRVVETDPRWAALGELKEKLKN